MGTEVAKASRRRSAAGSMQRVAMQAGVSVATVSRVVNRNPGVSDDLVHRVLSAMEETGYSPRVTGRAQGRVGRTGYIGLVMLGMSRSLLRRPTMFDLITGAERAAADYGLHLVVMQASDTGSLPSRLSGACMDGVLVLGHPSADIQRQLRGLNTVLLFGAVAYPDEEAWADWVEPDYGQIGRLACGQLLGRGHRRLGYVNAQSQHPGLEEAGRAFCRMAEDAGGSVLVPRPDQGAKGPIWDPDSGAVPAKALIGQILDEEPTVRPTGLFVTEHEITKIAYEMMRSRGLEPGGDIEIISRDGHQSEMVALYPEPVRILIDHVELGQLAVARLVWRIEHPDGHLGTRTLVPARLIVPAAH